MNQAIAHLLTGGGFQAPNAAVVGIDNDEIRAAVLQAAESHMDEVKSGGFVLETIGASFWSLLHGGSARESIELAVAFGDDADSTGAVTGAFVGAAYGATALPRSWVDQVQIRNSSNGRPGGCWNLSDAESPTAQKGGAASLR